MIGAIARWWCDAFGHRMFHPFPAGELRTALLYWKCKRCGLECDAIDAEGNPVTNMEREQQEHGTC